MTAPATLPPPTRRRSERPAVRPIPRPAAAAAEAVPPLRDGDRLTAAEFLRRYEAMPHHCKAELIGGRVYLMASPVSADGHGDQHFDLVTWLGVYRAATPGVAGSDNATVHLTDTQTPQPDILLRLQPECGGRCRLLENRQIEGPPELVAEIARSSVNSDLHDKLDAYRAHGVREYLVWRTEDAAVDWFALRGSGDAATYEPLPAGDGGVICSEVFPGLRLDPAALLRRDLGTVLAVLNAGLASGEHAAFAAGLAAKLDASAAE